MNSNNSYQGNFAGEFVHDTLNPDNSLGIFNLLGVQNTSAGQAVQTALDSVETNIVNPIQQAAGLNPNRDVIGILVSLGVLYLAYRVGKHVLHVK